MEEKTLGYLTHYLSISMQKALNIEFRNAGLDIQLSQYVVLRYLTIHKDVSQLALAEALDKDASAIKRSIDILEKKGLVNRIAVTKRKNFLELTQKAQEVMPVILKCTDSTLRKVKKDISEGHYEIFLSTLCKMIENTKDYSA